jgi:hypothetical protein
MPPTRGGGIRLCGYAASRSTQLTIAGAADASSRRPPLGDTTTKAVLRTRESPARRQLVGHHEANVVASIGVLPAGIAQPDDQPVNWRPTAKGAQG